MLMSQSTSQSMRLALPMDSNNTPATPHVQLMREQWNDFFQRYPEVAERVINDTAIRTAIPTSAMLLNAIQSTHVLAPELVQPALQASLSSTTSRTRVPELSDIELSRLPAEGADQIQMTQGQKTQIGISARVGGRAALSQEQSSTDLPELQFVDRGNMYSGANFGFFHAVLNGRVVTVCPIRQHPTAHTSANFVPSNRPRTAASKKSATCELLEKAKRVRSRARKERMLKVDSSRTVLVIANAGPARRATELYFTSWRCDEVMGILIEVVLCRDRRSKRLGQAFTR
jgi:hypothetical protein